jgi:hypothetical protein
VRRIKRERECCSFFLHKSSMVRSMVYSSIEICMYVSLIALGLTMTQRLGSCAGQRSRFWDKNDFKTKNNNNNSAGN